MPLLRVRIQSGHAGRAYACAYNRDRNVAPTDGSYPSISTKRRSSNSRAEAMSGSPPDDIPVRADALQHPAAGEVLEEAVDHA